MTRFDLATDLDCSVEQAWRLLTDPAVKNQWSRGLTTARDAGGDGRMDRAGAVREVEVDLPTRPRVQEVVTRADEPTRFAYRIFKASPLLRGVQLFHRHRAHRRRVRGALHRRGGLRPDSRADRRAPRCDGRSRNR
ncbi:MAG: SRPBCC family protein [Gordonia paraffinivorans]